jgi:hypothetical protein
MGTPERSTDDLWAEKTAIATFSWEVEHIDSCSHAWYAFALALIHSDPLSARSLPS